MPLYQRALGAANPAVANSLSTLALLHHEQGQTTQALPLAERSLAIRKQALGVDHPEVAESLTTLPRLYAAQGQGSEALPRYQRALTILEHALPDHPTTATTRDHVVALVRRMNRAEAARPSK